MALPNLVYSIAIPRSRINDTVRRILSVKFVMSLFENPVADDRFVNELESRASWLVQLKNGENADDPVLLLSKTIAKDLSHRYSRPQSRFPVQRLDDLLARAQKQQSHNRNHHSRCSEENRRSKHGGGQRSKFNDRLRLGEQLLVRHCRRQRTSVCRNGRRQPKPNDHRRRLRYDPERVHGRHRLRPVTDDSAARSQLDALVAAWLPVLCEKTSPTWCSATMGVHRKAAEDVVQRR